jgi:hypothetical protein
MSAGLLLMLPAAALRTTARMLRALADTGEIVAMVINPAGARRGRAAQEEAPAPLPRPVVVQPPLEVTEPTDVTAIVSLTAPRAIAALEGLSTTQLGELYDLESSQRRRSTVLQAIERALEPPADALALDDDGGPATELVYSTQTPAAR